MLALKQTLLSCLHARNLAITHEEAEMSAQNKIRLVAPHAEESSGNAEAYLPGGGRPGGDKTGLRMSLKERVRMMLDDPQAPVDYAECADEDMHTPVSDLYRTLSDRSARSTQICMDAEIRAIAAIEERVMAELRLTEADCECIAMEIHARKALAERLRHAGMAVADARAKEEAALNNLDTVRLAAGMGAGEPMDQRLQVFAQNRRAAGIRAHRMQSIRMDAELCAIQEISSFLEQEDLLSPLNHGQNISEETILQMALENGLLATQSPAHAAQGKPQMQHKGADGLADRLLDDDRTASWNNLVMAPPTLH
jgi:hypothetical protein